MTETPHRYTAALAREIEAFQQDRWRRERTFEAPNPAGPWADPQATAGRPKLFVADMFPYPSGAGLHVGHPLGYIATDVYARFQRMCGKNVLHTLGYDSFGLPAEQYAVQTGRHPRETTEANIAAMTAQLAACGFGHDPRRAVRTMDPSFYRWTQWIFLQLFNAWYDADAVRPDGGLGRARPIAELEEALRSGAKPTPDGTPWADLPPARRREIVDGHRLAYRGEAPVNWCPGLGTVLANEEVTNDGRSEVGNFPVYTRRMRQWMMRITAYADRLADDLDGVDWPESITHMQRHWIGRSDGAVITFAGTGRGHGIDVFTTRPDTVFGVAAVLVAPEHPRVADLVAPSWPDGIPASWKGRAGATPKEAVDDYVREALARSDDDRRDEGREKTGVFTGTYVTNPVTGAQVPVMVADYVLTGYGTGAIMAVPAEDVRDWQFAERFALPVVRTVQPPADHPDDRPYTGDGPAVNSRADGIDLDGGSIADSIAAVIAFLEQRGTGRRCRAYKLRDWLFSRQRYWGEPFPIVYDEEGTAHAVPESMLPVELPDVIDFSPVRLDPDDTTSEPNPPLARVGDWVEVDLDLGDGVRRYRRETNTMPQWAGSCWYYLRYLDPANEERFCDPEVERYWMAPGEGAGGADPGGVDLYVGGVEHAVLHLLYARFWHKVLYDLGHVSGSEPFRKLFNQGYIMAYAYRDGRGQAVPAAEVVERGDGSGETEYTWQGQSVTREYGKMGKSLKNVVTPDDMVEQYGADVFRVYEMSMGPLDVSRPWETRAVVGSQRFLQRVWRALVDEETGRLAVVDAAPDEPTVRLLHRTVQAVRDDYTHLRFNTAVARLIEFTNHVTKLAFRPRAVADAMVLMLAPLAPHMAEHLWTMLGHAGSLAHADFPVADPAMLEEDLVTCVVQVQGKVKERLEVAPDVTPEELEALALASQRILDFLDGRSVRKVIVRAPTLVNIVAG